MSKIVNSDGNTKQFTEHSIKTDDGIKIHYYRLGTGPLIICTHGFPDNAKSFLPTALEISKAGYTVLVPYLRGYYPSSSAPLNEYHVCYMAHDIYSLIKNSGFNDASLVGHDWGAQASLAAAILFPDMIKKLVVIGWSKPDRDQFLSYEYLKGIWHLYFFQSPFAINALKHNNYDFIEKWWSDASRTWIVPSNTISSVKDTFSKPGVVEAAIAQYRCKNIPPKDQNKYKEQEIINKGPVKVPTLLLHGTHDRDGRLDAFLSDEVLNYFESHIQRVVINESGHFLHQEKPDEVNKLIISFLSNEK